jgi:glucose-1-phosphatase
MSLYYYCILALRAAKMKTNSAIHTIIFDIGKVIIDFDVERPLGILTQHTPLGVAEMKERLYRSALPRQLETGQISTEEFCSGIIRLLDLQMNPEDLVSAWSTFFPDSLLLDESFFAPFCRSHPMMILSNTSAMHIRFIREKFRILDLFHSFVFSFEAGVMKPDEAIFRVAESKADCLPGAILFVDDIPAHIATAQKLGWQAILFEGKESLENHFQHLGLIPGHSTLTKEYLNDL